MYLLRHEFSLAASLFYLILIQTSPKMQIHAYTAKSMSWILFCFQYSNQFTPQDFIHSKKKKLSDRASIQRLCPLTHRTSAESGAAKESHPAQNKNQVISTENLHLSPLVLMDWMPSQSWKRVEVCCPPLLLSIKCDGSLFQNFKKRLVMGHQMKTIATTIRTKNA